MKNLESLILENWAYIGLNKAFVITDINEKTKKYFPNIKIGDTISDKIIWFRDEWLKKSGMARVVKTSQDAKVLMNILHDNDKYIILLKNVNDYHNVIHLWCEVEDSLIKLQHFIDNSHDGIIITNGAGIVRALNSAFCKVAGVNEDEIINKDVVELKNSGLIPQSPLLEVLEKREMCSEIIKFPHGKESIVSSKPLFDKQGNIIRVLSNVRDLSEMNELRDKIKTVEARVKLYENEFNKKLQSELQVQIDLNRSKIMEELYERVSKVADTDIPLMITGESGVGKTALAKLVHAASTREKSGSFVHINCSSIPEALLESELFGHEAGAFTGAQQSKLGLFEIANKGTILLDEIGDMPLTLQSKLLNVLQEKKFYRVGGTRMIATNARVIAATHQNLEKRIALGEFRSDLYFRLNVIPLVIPALRDRSEDIAPMLAHFLDQFNQKHHCQKYFSKDALNLLIQYDWPGNIRELINVVERVVILTSDDQIDIQQLPSEVSQGKGKLAEFDDTPVILDENPNYWHPGKSLKETIKNIEATVIEEALEYYGSLKETAEKLNVNESTITRKRSRYRKQ